VPDVRQLSPAAATPIGVSARFWIAILALLIVGGVVLAPLLLDTYMINILIRAFFVAIAAVTVDIMWGYCGTLTFGQSAFFGIGVYALAIVFTEYDFGSWQVLFAMAAAIIVSAAVAALTGCRFIRVQRRSTHQSSRSSCPLSWSRSSTRVALSPGRPAGSSDSRRSICRSRAGSAWPASASPPLPWWQ
jgi:hypothetical protein